MSRYPTRHSSSVATSSSSSSSSPSLRGNTNNYLRTQAPRSSESQAIAASSSQSSSNANGTAHQPIDPEEYNDTHRLFIQYLMEHQLIVDETLKDVFQNILQAYGVTGVGFTDFLNKVNRKLGPVFFEVRRVVSELDGLTYWSLVNTRSDEAAFLACAFNLAEIAFFKEVMRAIIKNKGEAKRSDCVRGQYENVSLTREKRAEALDRLINENWLAAPNGTVDEAITLGVRAFLELRPFFEEEEFRDIITECTICSEMIIKGERCKAPCTTAMHKHCSQRWFQRRDDMKCPTCQRPWSR